MRIVFDTNILLSALMVRGTPADRLYGEWRHGCFELASAEQQLEELNRVARRSFFQVRIKPSEIGRMVNDIRRLTLMCEPSLPAAASFDADEGFLLALAQAAEADYLVVGDESGLLALKHHGGTRIVTTRDMVALLG